MNMNKVNVCIDFNNTLLDMVIDIAVVSPDSIIGSNSSFIKCELKKPANLEMFIIIFINKVLPYQNEIKNKNEDFFLKKSYNGDTDNDNSIIDKIFEFKNIWKKLGNHNKEIIFQYMILLCGIANTYYEKFSGN